MNLFQKIMKIILFLLNKITLNIQNALKKNYLFSKDVIKELKLPELPEKIKKFLKQELKVIKKKNNEFNVVENIKEIFLKAFVKMFGNAVAESYDDDTYVLTFWGDRNNPNDIKTLQELQGRADDTWRDNGRVQLAIYNTEFYTGNQSGKFADKWGDNERIIP